MLRSTSAGNMTALSCLMKGQIFEFTFLFSLLQNIPLTAQNNHKTSTKNFNETPPWNVGVHVSRKYDCTELSHERFTFLFSLLRDLPLTPHYKYKPSTKTSKETPLWNVEVHVSRKYDCAELSHERSNKLFIHSYRVMCFFA